MNSNIPNHVAIIMDGNGRWAARKGFNRIEGHKRGAIALEEIIRSCSPFGVKTLTLYAFLQRIGQELSLK